jgi:hypothetical protein
MAVFSFEQIFIGFSLKIQGSCVSLYVSLEHRWDGGSLIKRGDEGMSVPTAKWKASVPAGKTSAYKKRLLHALYHVFAGDIDPMGGIVIAFKDYNIGSVKPTAETGG